MNGKAYGIHSPDPPQKISSPAPPPLFSSPAGQDHGRSATSAVKLEMRDYYAIQAEFIKYVDLDLLVPKLIAQRLVTEGEAYAVKNPYIVPHQRVFQLFQYISNKGPFAAAKLLQCLLEPPLHQGHAYIASRLLKEPQPEDSLRSQRLGPNPEVKKRLTKLKTRFAGLLLDTHKYLRDVPVSMQDLKIFVSFLTASDDNRSSLFFNNHIPRISSASSIDEIFSLLSENHYWTHLDYHILEAVVDRFGNEHLRKLVDSYTQEVDEFQNNTKLSDYCSSLDVKDTHPMKPDFVPVKARFDSDWDSYGMSQLQNAQSQMCQHFKLSPHSVMFQTAEPGSVCITWLVPSSVEAMMVVKSKELYGVFKTMGMLSLMIGNCCVLQDEEEDEEYVGENSEDTALYMNSRRTMGKITLSQIQSQELLKSLETMEDKLNDMTLSFEEHKSAVMSALGGGRSGTLTSVSTITEEVSMNHSMPLAASSHKVDSVDDDFELLPETIQRRRESDYGCNAEEWTGGDSGYSDPARWRQVSHFSNRNSDAISEEEEEVEQYVELEDYVPETKKSWNQRVEKPHPHQRLGTSPQAAIGSLQNRARSLEKGSQSEVLGQTQFKRKPVTIRDRPPAVPPRPPH